jgi:hypothetical protein
MKALCATAALVGLGGCGGSIAETASRDQEPSMPDASSLDASGSGDAPRIGVGPIDASGQPTELTMTCDGSSPQVSIKLPCLLGGDLGGGLHALECQRPNAASAYSPTDTVLSMLVPLVELSMQLNQTVSLPFTNLPLPPPGYFGPFVGAAVFTQVDLVSDAFVGTIEHASVPWIGSLGDTMTCVVVDGPFWAVAGPFLSGRAHLPTREFVPPV